MNKTTNADETVFPEDDLEVKPKATRRKPAAKKETAPKKVELTDKDKKAISRKMEDVVDAYLDKANTTTLTQEEYRIQGKRRFRCLVESTRPEFQIFELIMPHPDNPKKPITVRGRCGVIIEAGLTLFAIKRLKSSYTMKTRSKKQDPTRQSGQLHSVVKIPNYNVEVYEEIEKPLETGKIDA